MLRFVGILLLGGAWHGTRCVSAAGHIDPTRMCLCLQLANTIRIKATTTYLPHIIRALNELTESNYLIAGKHVLFFMDHGLTDFFHLLRLQCNIMSYYQKINARIDISRFWVCSTAFC